MFYFVQIKLILSYKNYSLISNLQDKKVFHIPSACASAIVLGQHDLHGYLVDVCRLKLTHIHFVRSNLRIVSSSKWLQC